MRKYVKLKPRPLNEAADLYEKDWLSIREVAKRLGVSYGTAHGYLREGGVILRPHGGWRRKARG